MKLDLIKTNIYYLGIFYKINIIIIWKRIINFFHKFPIILLDKKENKYLSKLLLNINIKK